MLSKLEVGQKKGPRRTLKGIVILKEPLTGTVKELYLEPDWQLTAPVDQAAASPAKTAVLHLRWQGLHQPGYQYQLQWHQTAG